MSFYTFVISSIVGPLKNELYFVDLITSIPLAQVLRNTASPRFFDT